MTPRQVQVPMYQHSKLMRVTPRHMEALLLSNVTITVMDHPQDHMHPQTNWYPKHDKAAWTILGSHYCD